MATIEDIIRQEVNPFDPVTFKTGNFWQEDNYVVASTVDSIHQDAIVQITQVLNQIAKDNYTRTVMLAGDAGSGKSYVLKRLKQTLNSKAFFAYISPFVDSDYIWRHTLRQTVDSMMHKPEGKEESQLLLWLKSLSVFRDRNLMKKLLGERNLFINNFKAANPSGIFQAKEFFGVLYDLTNPDLYFTACSWLRGDDLDEDDLKALKVKKSIDSETAAQGILANLGKISVSTYPIVLCFDQVESKQLPDGSADIQPVFNISTSFHNERLKNFLIIISIVTNTWRQNSDRIQQSDRDRVEKLVALKPITLDQAESLWTSRLSFLHHQASPKPESNIYPLTREMLEKKFPGGKTTPRLTLVLGQQSFLKHKLGGEIEIIQTDIVAFFKLLWEQEFKKTEQKITRIRHFSEPELISMLSRTLAALQMKEIQPKLLPSPTYSSYSFTCRNPKRDGKIGLIWSENPSSSFFHVMNACQRVSEKQQCRALYLIRAEGTGKANSKSYGIYKKIFVDSTNNRHIKPDVESVHYLATYDRMVNSVHSQELVVAGETIKLSELEALIRDSEVLKGCPLLQDLGIFPRPKMKEPDLRREKEFLLSFVKIHHLISRKVASQNTFSQFPKLNDAQMKHLIQELCQEKLISILDESVSVEDQIIYLVPNQSVA
ncbi:ATP-binding protein [Kovacikia minuta CCNUW1]|uniref:ATP-binding protein n=1 Tax=Kovacikia minuta TaxID=2931930 RepID=UPI001CCEF74A|nr:ATP-binding protein [Kovacikia minuta]UBF27000.1 ATP-binding protein [Kovacikia minuta CCNUW1]